jgi:hypothetical protein
MMLVQWFRRTYPDVRIFSVPNGGHRHPAVAAKMKATGVSSGVPDWIAYLESVGFCCIVGKGADHAKQQISAFFINHIGPK